jgi:hypothetical protein
VDGASLPSPKAATNEDVSKLSAWWSSIGERIASVWDARARAEESFPEVAANVLADSPPPVDRLAVGSLAWLADAALPSQHNMGTGFGQPAVTVYRDDDFIVYLLFWFEETITIHDHRFSGAFSVIEGQSLQNVYELDDVQAVLPGFSAGNLRCTKVETLGPGQVRLIPPGPGLIHSNVHFAFPSPTVSLVARTLVKGEGHPQHFYSHDGLAFTDQGQRPETAKRLQGFAASCRISPQAGTDFLRRALVSASPHEVVSYVAAATSYFGSALYLGPFLAESSLAVSEDARRLVLGYARQLYTSYLALTELPGLVDNRDRLLMSLVAAGTHWERATDVISQLIPGTPLRPALCRLVSGLVHNLSPARRNDNCALSEQAGQYVNVRASELTDGGAAPPSERVYTELVTHRLFGSLFRFVLSPPGAEGGP